MTPAHFLGWLVFTASWAVFLAGLPIPWWSALAGTVAGSYICLVLLTIAIRE